ncbi:hypothetical protein GCM10010510_31850 [Streptomyces anandii JCM 4720]|nr:hypothetical protein GCM10010510_31850 [Streptomyces anandii JCM 4720]
MNSVRGRATTASPLWTAARRPSGRPATAVAPPAEQIVERPVGRVGGFVVAGKRIQLGRGYARQGVTVHLSEDVIRVFCRS